MKTQGARRWAMVVGFVALVGGFVACGSDKKEDDDSTDTKLNFTTDINPILKASCSGESSCHAAGTMESIQLIDKEGTFKANATKVKEQLDSGAMPKAPATISAADKQKLLDFLAQ